MNPGGARILFAGTIFSSAFLLFLIQPLIAKQILPWFGGSAAVWSICMVFFQVALLAGYAYSDWIARHLRVRAQALLHGTLLLASLAFLPIVTSARWKPTGAEDPTLWILGLLVGTIGLPYFLLSTTGPLVQSWVARTPWGAQVYRYFSLSNLASLVSLLAYPVLIEPHSALLQQALRLVDRLRALRAALLRHRRVHGAPLERVGRALPVSAAIAAPPPPAPRTGDYLLWLALPALGSWLLLAITNHITQNVAAIPFLWVLPLSVYLLSFVLSFESDRWYRRPLCLPLAAGLLALCAFGLQDDLGFNVKTAIPLYVVGLFALCMFLHGEMARLRPAARWLTRFYLMLSLGGAMGGVTVGLIAPQVLPAYYELGHRPGALAALVGAVLLRGAPFRRAGGAGAGRPRRLVPGAAGAQRRERRAPHVAQLLRHPDHARHTTAPTRPTTCARCTTARSSTASSSSRPKRRREPTAYYGPQSGIGLAIAAAGSGPRHVGLIGLGAGTLATYGRRGDTYRVYEINPQVFELADTEFSFLADSAAQDRPRAGRRPAGAGARGAAGLRRAGGRRLFRRLGADPPHHRRGDGACTCATLRADGIVAFHVTNRFLALAPVVEKMAQANGLHVGAGARRAAAEPGCAIPTGCWWRATRRVLAQGDIGRAVSPITPVAGLEPWTDDFNNLFGVLK